MTSNESLNALFAKHGSDKGWMPSRRGVVKGHFYGQAYTMFCRHLLARPRPRILEIGVAYGSSLKAWREWFGPDVEIWGIEIDPNIEAEGFKLFYGRQEDPDFLKTVVDETGGRFDLIVDDGSHLPQDQTASFDTLWPYVSVGGVYVIEDCWMNHRISARGRGYIVERLRGKGYNAMSDHCHLQKISSKKKEECPTEMFISFCGHAVFVVKSEGWTGE